MIFETLYRFAKKYNCSFNYYEKEDFRTCGLIKDDNSLSYAKSSLYEGMMVNGERYEDFQQALLDFERRIDNDNKL